MKKIIITNSIIVLIIFELTCRIVPFIKNYTSFSSTGYGVDSTGRIDFLTLNTINAIQKENYQNNGEFSYEHHQMNTLRLFDEEKRIVDLICLGDSYTQGIGAPPDSSYPKLLIKKGINVLNAGLSGSNTVQQKNLIHALLEKERVITKKVSIAINMSDIADLETNLFLKNKKQNFLFENSVFVRFFYRLVKSGDWSIIFGIKNNHEKTIDLIYHILKDMNSFCKDKNIEFIVIFHPTQYELERNQWYFSLLIKKLKKENYQVIDILEEFTEKGYQEQSSEIFWPKDGHNNSRGYYLIAESISETILKLNSVKK